MERGGRDGGPLDFTKMHGAGNDYVYIDARGRERDWPALAIAMSDRHTGVGSDGIILMADSDRADLRMRMYNADGSQGEMCGNGIRCLVKFALDRRVVPCDVSPVAVETLAGVRQVTPVWEDGRMVGASVTMGEPRLRPQDVPVAAPGSGPVMDHPLRVNGYDLSISCVSMGNPHAVAFLREPVDEFPLHEVGPVVERHQLFRSASTSRSSTWRAAAVSGRGSGSAGLGSRWRAARGPAPWPWPPGSTDTSTTTSPSRCPEETWRSAGRGGEKSCSKAPSKRYSRASGPTRVANQTPKTLLDSRRRSTRGEHSSRYDKVANQTQKHCWTAVGAAPGADTPLGTTQDGRRDSEDAWIGT